MARKIALVFVALFVLTIVAERGDATTISPYNPYRSFNISGINYGSMQWERDHRGNNHSYSRQRSGRMMFRRR